MGGIPWRKTWRWLGHLSIVHWLWTIGGSAILTVLLRGFTNLPIEWIVVLGVGVAMILVAAFRTFAPRARGRGNAATVRTSVSLTVRRVPAPGSPHVELIDFDLQGRPATVIDTSSRPGKLVFFPKAETKARRHQSGRRREQLVTAADLPATVRCGRLVSRTLFRVTKFLDNGFAIQEEANGEQVIVEVYPAE